MAAQLPDKILLNGEQVDLYTNPLEQYWIRNDKKHPRFLSAPNCQRGYVAHWEIKDDQLLEVLMKNGMFFSGIKRHCTR